MFVTESVAKCPKSGLAPRNFANSVAVGGIFKWYIKEREQETLLSEPGEELVEAKEQLYFGWKQKVRKYRKIAPLHVK